MKVLKKSPILRSTAKTGKAKFWQLIAAEIDGQAAYIKSWWQEGAKVQESVPVFVHGKNEGRSNETTDKEQLMSEFDSIVQKQRDKGYSESGSNKHVPTKPMLAHKYKESKHRLTWPVYVQPKLDGFRMLKEGDGSRAYTRGGKEHVSACVKHLMWDTGDYMVDGELILPGNQKLQLTAQAAKKYRPGVSEQLQYFVYDVVIPNLPFSKRLAILRGLTLTGHAPKNVVLVPTIRVDNEEQMFDQHSKFVSAGYEGTIVRTDDTGYEIGQRSHSLLKYKDFQDEEFEIVDVVEGKGSFTGKAILVCETKKGVQFNATPEGTMEYRADLWKNRKKIIGKFYTVRFAYYSEEGKPVFPIGVDFREKGEF